MALLHKVRVIFLHKVIESRRVLLGWVDDVKNVVIKLNVELWKIGPSEGF